MNVLVFCSAKDLSEFYTLSAKQFARLLAESGHNLVWGGSDRGIMRVMAEGVEAAGGEIHGVSQEELKEHARQGATSMFIAPDLFTRKARMLELADAIVALPGGLGTLDEVTEVIEHKKHGRHNKPILILNTAGFYDGLHRIMTRMEDDGMLPKPLDEYVYFPNTPREAIAYLALT